MLPSLVCASRAAADLVYALAADAEALGNLCEGEAAAPPFYDGLSALGPGCNLLGVGSHAAAFTLVSERCQAEA